MADTQATTCFLEKIENLKRGGPDLVAESESTFSREVFVLHPKDVEFLQKLENMPPKVPFLIMIIGVPGVGKSALLKTLLIDEREIPRSIRNNTLLKTVRERYNFLDLSRPIRAKHDITRENVWVVPTVDEYFSPSSREHIAGLLTDINRFMKAGDSIILTGNQGMFVTPAGERDPRKKIRDVVANRVKNPQLKPMIFEPWIKEYGGDPASVQDRKNFTEFSFQTLKFISDHLEVCYDEGCKCNMEAVCEQFLNLMREVLLALGQDDFVQRIYDLLCSVRLRRHDVFLTPRALLVFWASACSNLFESIPTSDHEGAIYQAVFESHIISSIYSRSYKLQETDVDIYRSREVDKTLFSKYTFALADNVTRRTSRLKLFFRGEIENPIQMIYDRAYATYLDQERSSEIIRKAFRYFFVYTDKRFQKQLSEIEKIIEREEWLLYLFNTEFWTKRKREVITNKQAIEEFVEKYLPLEVRPADFNKRSRKILVSLKDKSFSKPEFEIDLETFLPFLMLSKGFYVDFSLHPSILAKIERITSELQDIFRIFFFQWLERNMSNKERMSSSPTFLSKNGTLVREEEIWK